MADKLPLKRSCGTMDVHEALWKTDPNYRYNRQAINLKLREVSRLFRQARRTQLVTIPVVVHVVYNSEDQNISEEQIKSQIDVLNKDYRGKNKDRDMVPGVFKPLCADALVEFKLADKDPGGSPIEGITRTKTNKTKFSEMDSGVKFSSKGGHDAWPRDTYLNLWVCDLRDGLLGYAQFPGGPEKTDGVVINYLAFGTTGTATAPFNKGRTAVHEVGHWLDLIHIWGDTICGTDEVDDTPPQKDKNFESPQFPHISDKNCNPDPNGDMFMNYMDYVDDASMYMFTLGQAARIDATLATTRSSLVKPEVKDIVIVGDPAIIIAPDGRMDIFVRASDNALWHRWQTQPSAGWSDWEDLSRDKWLLGKDLIGNPTAVRTLDGKLDVFVVAVDNSLWHLAQTAPGGEWTTWEIIR